MTRTVAPGYAVNTLYRTIQGEGCQTGLPMTLVRLQGCDVGCPFCDTKETWQTAPTMECVRSEQEPIELVFERARGQNRRWFWATSEELVSLIRTEAGKVKWVLLTGGEPADQDLYPLVRDLQEAGFKVALETSGTAAGFLLKVPNWVCVSPKLNMPGKKTIRPAVIVSADEIKWLIGKDQDLQRLQDFLSDYTTKASMQVCLQPLSQSEKATALCLRACLEYGYRLSVQTHKPLGLP